MNKKLILKKETVAMLADVRGGVDIIGTTPCVLVTDVGEFKCVPSVAKPCVDTDLCVKTYDYTCGCPASLPVDECRKTFVKAVCL